MATRVGKAFTDYQHGFASDRLSMIKAQENILIRLVNSGEPMATMLEIERERQKWLAEARAYYFQLAKEMRFTPRADHCWLREAGGRIYLGWVPAQDAMAMIASCGVFRP